MLDTPKTLASIIFCKHGLLCSLVILTLACCFFFCPSWCSVPLYLFFLYLSTHQLHEPSSSPERKECIIRQETVRKAVTPLWHLVLIAAFTISLKLIRDRRPGGQKGRETKLQTIWRNCQNSCCPRFSSKTSHNMLLFYCLLFVWESRVSSLSSFSNNSSVLRVC